MNIMLGKKKKTKIHDLPWLEEFRDVTNIILFMKGILFVRLTKFHNVLICILSFVYYYQTVTLFSVVGKNFKTMCNYTLL